jgi:hypothetical protein
MVVLKPVYRDVIPGVTSTLDCRMVSSVIVDILMVPMVKSVTVCVTYTVLVVNKGTDVVE